MNSNEHNDSKPPDDQTPGYGGWIIGLLAGVALLAFLFRKDANPPPPPETSLNEGTGILVESNAINAPIDPLTALITKHTPLENPIHGYVGAEKCQECHEDQHHTWFHTYHRKMTQKATVDSVIPKIDDLILTHGTTNPAVRLFRENGRFWAEFRNPDGSPVTTETTPSRQPIVMTTGSHHQQLLWLPTGRGRSLVNVPYIYLIETGEWIPLGSNFVQPPGEAVRFMNTKWNTECLRCHTTHPRAREIEEGVTYDTMIGQLGISCESCHGPGAPHITHHRQNTNTTPDPIANPHKMDHRISSQICGSCHSFNTVREDIPFEDFRPGQNLHVQRQVLRFDKTGREALRASTTDTNSVSAAIEKLGRMFWRDGIPRATGREYQGLMHTTCHTEGEMSCMSCHRMHQAKSDERPIEEWTDDLLDHRRLGDGACTQCHDTDKYSALAHTRHAAGSAGSQCMNCHMPHTSYGLLKAIRSHGITSPDVAASRDLGRPNACNLCHLDQSIEWTANKLKEWYDIPIPNLTQDERELAAGPLWTIKGDAGVRALAAWHMSWEPARKASGKEWIAPYLAMLLKDPYDAVRFLARRSTWQTPDYENLKFNFIDGPTEQKRASGEVLSQWEEKGTFKGRKNAALLIDEQGRFDRTRATLLLKDRDETPIYLLE